MLVQLHQLHYNFVSHSFESTVFDLISPYVRPREIIILQYNNNYNNKLMSIIDLEYCTDFDGNLVTGSNYSARSILTWSSVHRGETLLTVSLIVTRWQRNMWKWHLHRLARDWRQSGPHNGEIIHQAGAQIFLLRIHGCNLQLCHRFVQRFPVIRADDGLLSGSPADRIMAVAFSVRSSASGITTIDTRDVTLDSLKLDRLN